MTAKNPKARTNTPHPAQSDPDYDEIRRIIQESAWRKVRGIKADHFMRDLASALRGEKWKEDCTFGGFEMPTGNDQTLGKVGLFYSRRTGRKFDISAKLVPKNLQVGDYVTLDLIGCCNIVSISKR